jgi:4,5-dihydroxyphthalate decarboxylase
MVDIGDAVLYERFEPATRALEHATQGALTMSTVGTVTDRTPLRTLLGDHPTTRALRHGALTSPILPLAFADVAVPHKAFKRVVREVEFDVAEIALMTLLMAQSRGVPLKLMPVVVFSRNPLRHLVCDRERRPLTPADLPGCRIAVRSYTTTTAVWIRALLADQFGVDAERAEWVTLDEGHVAGVPDPPNVHRDTSGSDLMTMLSDGAVEAAIVDPIPTAPRFVPIVPDPDATFRAWQARHGARTLNHVIAVRESLAGNEDAMRELFRLFRESRTLGGDAVDQASTPLGFDANRRNLEVALTVADVQHLLGRPLTVDDLVTDVLASLR